MDAGPEQPEARADGPAPDGDDEETRVVGPVAGDDPVPAGPDRDLAALERLEADLASLEGELDRVEGSGAPATGPPDPAG